MTAVPLGFLSVAASTSERHGIPAHGIRGSRRGFVIAALELSRRRRWASAISCSLRSGLPASPIPAASTSLGSPSVPLRLRSYAPTASVMLRSGHAPGSAGPMVQGASWSRRPASLSTACPAALVMVLSAASHRSGAASFAASRSRSRTYQSGPRHDHRRLTARCSGPGRCLVLPERVQLATRRLLVACGGRAAERQR